MPREQINEETIEISVNGEYLKVYVRNPETCKRNAQFYTNQYFMPEHRKADAMGFIHYSLRHNGVAKRQETAARRFEEGKIKIRKKGNKFIMPPKEQKDKS